MDFKTRDKIVTEDSGYLGCVTEQVVRDVSEEPHCLNLQDQAV